MNDRKQDVQIRLMCVADLPQVAALEARIFSLPWSEDSFRKALTYTEQILLTAVKKKDLQEMVCGYSVLFRAADQADVCNIAISPEERGQGLGALLMQEMLLRAKNAGVKEVFLEVRESNEAAIGLYKKYGFYQISVRKGYYDEPKEDALLMKADICE